MQGLTLISFRHFLEWMYDHRVTYLSIYRKCKEYSKVLFWYSLSTVHTLLVPLVVRTLRVEVYIWKYVLFLLNILEGLLIIFSNFLSVK